MQNIGGNEVHRCSLVSNKLSTKISSSINLLLKKENINRRDILVAGIHGQTIRHKPEDGYTVQLCNPAIVAQATGITVVHDFRTRDIVRGGQGAPLTPLFHKEISDTSESCAFVNVGGLANVTLISNFSNKITEVDSGFDTGPGNCLSDLWITEVLKKPFDERGGWAKSGIPNKKLLKIMLRDPFFKKNPPKSISKEYFDLNWLTKQLKLLKIELSDQDIQATVVELVSITITDAIPKRYTKIYVCGGGEKNDYLIDRMMVHAGRKIISTACLGWPPESIEAACFAWLATKTLAGDDFPLKGITGSRANGKIGSITLA